MTSQDAVTDVRRALHVKRVGHTGTLDPGACGVLPICVGRATRLFDYLADKEKEYVAEITFGTTTDTLDAYGCITASSACAVTESELSAVLPRFLGEQEQKAPMYSAVSVEGVRLYKLARQGVEVERKKRRVSIYSIDLIRQCGENVFLLKIRCSKGTYIRTLCEDIAEALGTLGYLSFLLRTASGRFAIDSAMSIAELETAVKEGREDELILPTDEALSFMPEVRFSDNRNVYKKLINGAEIPYECERLVRVYYDDVFIGIGECEKGRLRIKTQLCEG